MYKATVRALMRHGLNRLNAGDSSFILRLASPKAELAFPGDNSLAAMYRPVVKSADAHVTHRGAVEIAGFADRFMENGTQFECDDILVNGLPHNCRVAVRGRTRIPGPTANDPDEYTNRAVAFITIRWGRMVAWEDYEDCERVAAWDAARAAAAPVGTGRAEPARP